MNEKIIKRLNDALVHTNSFSFIPVSGAFEPVEDVGAAGVVDLVKRVSVRLLHSHGIAARGRGYNHGLCH